MDKAREQNNKPKEEKVEKKQLNWAIIGGLMMAVFSVAGLAIGGQVYGSRTALELIEVMSPPLQMLAFATITATMTMLALILTMLGLIKQAEVGFGQEFYKLIERISLIATFLLIISALLLTLLAIPITEAEIGDLEVWVTTLYYILTFVNSLIVGLLVATVLMLYDSIKSVIRALNPQNT